MLQSATSKLFDGLAVRFDADWSACAGGEGDGLDEAMFAMGANSTDHGFHFRQFGHDGRLPGESDLAKTERVYQISLKPTFFYRELRVSGNGSV